MPPDVKWRKREKWNDKEHHEKASFFNIAEFWNSFVLLYFWINVFFTSCVIGKRSSETLRNNRLQMFFKTGVLKTFLNIRKKHLCLSLCNKAAGLKASIFIKKEIPTQVFYCKYC